MKKLTFLFLVTVFILLSHSCREDIVLNESDYFLKSSLTNEKGIIDEARAWFENNPSENLFSLLKAADKLKWEKAVVNDLDSILITEVPIKLKDHYYAKVADNEQLNIEHRLLIFKEGNSFYSLMEYFISEKDLKYLQHISKNKYSKKESEFDGIVVLTNSCNEVISTKWITKKTKSGGVKLKSSSVSGYCVYLGYWYEDGHFEAISLMFCVLPYLDSSAGSGGGGSGSGSETTTTLTDEEVADLPEVYTIELEQNEKAKCIYDKLTEGNESILNDFIKRYFPPVKPFLPALGELNLQWTLGSTTETLPYGDPMDDGTFNSVVIRLKESSFDDRSTTFNALNILHEALHAKLIAEFYDQVGSTDFDKLFAYYQGFGFKNIDKQQEQEMLNLYLTDIATGLKNFDESQGIFNDLDEYKAAIRYDISVEIFGLSYSTDDHASYLKILIKSTTNCN